MNILKSAIITIPFACASLSSAAESDGSKRVFVASAAAVPAQFATFPGNISIVSGNLAGATSSIHIPSLGETADRRMNVISVRDNLFSGGIGGSGMLVNNDRVYTSVYVPMRGINNALTLVGTAMQSRLADSLVTLVQAISVVARRQVNTELSYSLNVNGHSRVDSMITCRLRTDATGGNAAVVASLRYNSRF